MNLLRTIGSLACLLTAACDSGPPPAVPPQSPPPLEKARYPNATLLIGGVDPEQETVVLTQGQEYEYSGSFELANPEQEPSRLARLIYVKLLVDLEASGYGEGPETFTGEPPTEVTVGQGRGQVATIDRDNTVHFSGRFEAPRKSGEVEVRVIVRDEEDLLPVISRRLEIVEGEDEVPDSSDS